MKKYPTIQILFCCTILAFILNSCNRQSTTNAEFENLKKDLFKKAKDISELPIYADPPTQDYNDFKKGVFLFQIDSSEIKKIIKYRKELEPYILQYIDSGYSWVYLSAFLRYESAVPKIKNLLLKCNKFYGWEGGDYSKIERYLDDEQYCYQMVYIAAIEFITGKPISKAITLSDPEYYDLKTKADKCKECDKDALAFCYARWLLNKLNFTIRFKSDIKDIDFEIKTIKNPNKQDYIVETYSGVDSTSQYAKERNIDKGLIGIYRLGSNGEKNIYKCYSKNSRLRNSVQQVKQYKINKDKINSIISVKYCMDVYDKYDMVFCNDSIYFIHTTSANAGIFVGSEVKVIPIQKNEFDYFSLFSQTEESYFTKIDRGIFYSVLLYCSKFNITN